MNNAFTDAINKSSESWENITREEWEKIKKDKEVILSQLDSIDSIGYFNSIYWELEKAFESNLKEVTSFSNAKLLELRLLLWVEKVWTDFEIIENNEWFILSEYNKNILEEIYNKFWEIWLEKVHWIDLDILKIIYNNIDNVTLDNIENIYKLTQNRDIKLIINYLFQIELFSWDILENLDYLELSNLTEHSYIIDIISKIEWFNWNILENLDSWELNILTEHSYIIDIISRIEWFNWGILENLDSWELNILNEYSYIIDIISKIEWFNWNILENLDSWELNILNEYSEIVNIISKIKWFSRNILKNLDSWELSNLTEHSYIIDIISKIKWFNWGILEKLDNHQLENLNKYSSLTYALSQIDWFNWNIFGKLDNHQLENLNKYSSIAYDLSKIDWFNWNILKKLDDNQLENLDKYSTLTYTLSQIDWFNWNILKKLDDWKLKNLDKYSYVIKYLSQIDWFNWDIFEKLDNHKLENLNKHLYIINYLSQIGWFNWDIFEEILKLWKLNDLDPSKLDLFLRKALQKKDLIFAVNYLLGNLNKSEVLSYYNNKSNSPRIFSAIFESKKDDIIKSINRLHEPVDGMNEAQTVEKRKEIASNLLDIELFNLIWYWWELYTSSFRDILIPELVNRLNKSKVWFIGFIKTVDKSWEQTLNFISAIIERWTIQKFNLKEWELVKVFDLIKNEIFKNKENLIKFSLWLEKLFSLWNKKVTEHIVNDLIDKYENSWENIKQAIEVIFVYSKDRLWNIDSNLKTKVDTYLNKSKADIQDYLSINSNEWLKDNKLETKSVFVFDSDWKLSYHSFCRELLRNSYKFDIKENMPTKLKYILEKINSRHDITQEKWKSEKDEVKARNRLVEELVLFISNNKNIEITLTKKVNNVEIKHNLKVYTSSSKDFIKDYLKSWSEWYIQRGHSYNRSELIDEQLSSLTIEEKKKLKWQSNFVYLWSCWWMNDYTKVSESFWKKSDITATTWTWTMYINNPYVRRVFEYIAQNKGKKITWKDVAENKKIKEIFSREYGEDYVVPWSLPHLLLKLDI